MYSNLLLSDPKSIRLLTILPGNHEDNIRCELEVVNLDAEPACHALSYVWNS